MTTDTPIYGTCTARFGAVKDAFVANFVDSGEVGARVAVLRDGESVVDLWGGYRTEQRDVEWDDRTLVCCMSVSKGVTALAAHLLADRGLLDYEAPVAKYWPQFAQSGKDKITVRQALSHQASLAIIDSAEPGDALDWERFTAKIAAQRPNWPPGTNEAYHSLTYGYIVGEIVRRIDGRRIEKFIAEEIARPLEADFIIGCTDADLERVALQIPNPANELVAGGGLLNEKTRPVFAAGPKDPRFMGSPEFLKAVIPSASGVSNGLGVARMFAPFAMKGEYRGRRFLKPATIRAAAEEQWHHADSIFGNDFRVTMGFLLNTPFNNWGREGNVGTAGAGGYAVFADPDHRVSFGYTPNRFTSGQGLGREPKRIIDALYRCIS